jgi:hypothetical protein
VKLTTYLHLVPRSRKRRAIPQLPHTPPCRGAQLKKAQGQLYLYQRWATGWTIGVLGFDSRRGLGIFLFTTASRTALEPTQPLIQWVPGSLSLGVKRPGREADHSLPSSAEVKNAWSYTSTPQYVFMASCLVQHRDNFTFTLSSTFI